MDTQNRLRLQLTAATGLQVTANADLRPIEMLELVTPQYMPDRNTLTRSRSSAESLTAIPRRVGPSGPTPPREDRSD